VPSADLSTAILFILFLMLFVAIGIFPAWKRTAGRLRDLLARRAQPGQLDADAAEVPAPILSGGEGESLRLDDFDIFVLRRLAQAGGQGLSRRQLQAALHFELPLIGKTLASLQQRGLVEVVMPFGFGSRFCLSARGRAFAAGEGYLPSVRRR